VSEALRQQLLQRNVIFRDSRLVGLRTIQKAPPETLLVSPPVSAPPRITSHSLSTISSLVTTKHGTILRVRRVFLMLCLVFTRTYSQGVPIGLMAIMLAMIASMGGVSA
jgi:hypothetical protein